MKRSPDRGESVKFSAYLFAYFRGNTIEGEQIFMAISRGNNALVWDVMNGGEPVFKSTLGTRGLRDPYLFRLEDGAGFCLLATDLSIGSGTTWQQAVTEGSRDIQVWKSTNLIDWSEQFALTVGSESAKNVWAPKAIYDPQAAQYMLYWSSIAGSSNYQRVFFSHTSDFEKVSEPRVWIDNGDSTIDVSLLKQNQGWLRFSKDEGARTGCVDILEELLDFESPLTATSNWTEIESCIGSRFGLKKVEGPIALGANPGDKNGEVLYLFLDQYEGGGYVPLLRGKGKGEGWITASEYELPADCRHGSIIPITEEEERALRSAYISGQNVGASSEGCSL